MRAAVLRAYNENLSIEDVPEPACPRDGVVLKVVACGVCRSDHHGWSGEHPLVKPGHIPGHEFCGEVVKAGPEARFRAGDKVIAPFLLSCGGCLVCQSGQQTVCPNQKVVGFSLPGAFAEYVAVPFDHNLTYLPDGMPPSHAAALGCRVTTVWHALTDRAELRPGEWLVVHGTGGIGFSALLLGKALGARVVAVDVVKEKLTHAAAHGAEVVVDASEGRAAERIRDATGGGGHVSIDALGAPTTANASIECLRPLGRHVQIGMPTGHTARMDINMNAVYMGNLALYGTRGMPSWKFPGLLGLIETGAIDVASLIAREIALSGVSAELHAMNGPTAPGVAVVTNMAG